MNYRLLYLLICSLLVQGSLLAQPSRTTIKGILRDTTEVIPYAAIMLLNPQDSSLITYTTTNPEGEFSFNSMRNVPYLLKATHINHLPLQKYLEVSATSVNDLGDVIMKPIAHELMEVVIRSARAPLFIRGDTIEYDASTFKVPIGSTVEDLLKRLPGIEVDADGNIKTQGQDVRRMYVDGKTFFGNDPKSVTKNLGAEAISKVQVFNEKSEQTKLTGVDDGTKEKAINLELKEGFKKGNFGKASVAGGTADRWASRGSFNRFDDKNQLSFIGYANNTNQTGVNWEDYSEFRGSNTFNDFDNGDFGFGGGRGHVIIIGNDMGISFYDGRGMTKNGGGGVNYNYDNKKTKFSGSYLYSQTALDLFQLSSRKTLLETQSFNSLDTTRQDDFRANHSIGTRLEMELDSNNRIIAKANFKFSLNDKTNQQNQLFFNTLDQPFNNMLISNTDDLNSNTVNTSVIYRRNFAKKGRSFAISGGYSRVNTLNDQDLNSLNTFFRATDFTEQIRSLVANDQLVSQVKSSAMFTEPLSKKWFWQTFYNFTQTGTEANRQTRLPQNLGGGRVDSLSVYYDNRVDYNRLGSMIQYSFEGLNIGLGAAYQQLVLNGKYATDNGLPWLEDPLKRVYNNITPYVSANYEFSRGKRLMFSYENMLREPSFNDLQPVKNLTNPAYRVVGNPDLKPENNHQFGLDYHYWNQSSFASMFVSFNYDITKDPIVYNQSIVFDDKLGLITTTQPENMDQGSNTGLWLNFSYPIVKTKLTASANVNLSFSDRPALVNSTLNTTNSKGYRGGVNLSYTPGSKLQFNLGTNLNVTDIKYSIQESQNQVINNTTVRSGIKWEFIPKTFFESDFNYLSYRNDKFGFDRNTPIWNGSVRRLLDKGNRFELRLAGFDLLDKNVTIRQFATQNYVMTNETNTLARYFMLSLTFNMRGFETRLSQRGGMMF